METASLNLLGKYMRHNAPVWMTDRGAARPDYLIGHLWKANQTILLKFTLHATYAGKLHVLVHTANSAGHEEDV